jgi:hypothetical protein
MRKKTELRKILNPYLVFVAEATSSCKEAGKL